MKPLPTLMSSMENSGKIPMTQTSNKVTQTEKRQVAENFNFFVFFSFKANKRQNKAKKNRLGKTITKVKGCVKLL